MPIMRGNYRCFFPLIWSLYARNRTKSQLNSHATVNRSKNQRLYVARNHAKTSRCEIRLITNIIVSLLCFVALTGHWIRAS